MLLLQSLKNDKIISICLLFLNIFMQLSSELEKASEKFYREKARLPKDIAWKLQYMLDYINNKAQPLQQLTEQQQNDVKDIEEMTPKALKLIFTSIVNSILSSSNMYSSFEKNCKLKVQGMIPRWISVYASFHESQVHFTNRKRVFRFVIDNLECHKLSELELEFKYHGVQKGKIKFQSPEAANNMIAMITQLISEREKLKKKQTGETEILTRKHFQQSLNHDYVIEYKSKQNIVMAHKSQPRVHITMFLKGQFWNIIHLMQFLVTQKTWNNKVVEQNFMVQDKSRLLVQRRWRSSNFFALQRRTLTQIKFFQINESCFIIEQNTYPGTPTSKSIILSEIHFKIILDILSPKIIKVTIDCLFNAKGYCNRESSRKMLIDLLSDFKHIQEKYRKLKEKGRLFFKLPVQQSIATVSIHGNSELLSGVSQEKQGYKKSQKMEKQVRIQTENYQKQVEKQREQIFYSVTTNRHYLGTSFCAVDNQINDKGEQFFDIDNFDDEELVQGSGNSMEGDSKKNSQNQIESKTAQEIRNSKGQQINQGNVEVKKSFQSLLAEFLELRPLNYSQLLSLSYIKLIKQRVYERIYLKKHFQQKEIDNFLWQTPFYDPSVIIPSGKQYEVSKDNELVFINYELIKSQKDSLIFIIKQIGANIISGKSVLGVSMPVDIFESRSLLQRSAASFGCAPKYLKPVADADVYTQLKAVTGFMLSVSPLQLIMQKPFNPILGQTLQAYIGGVPIYYQQISHHPPISAYYMTCPQFKIYGNLVAVANVSLNSGTGGNAGKMKVLFRNGNQFQISFFAGEISGLIYGKRKYSISGKAFVLQRSYRLVAQISAHKDSKGLYQWEQVGRKPTSGDIIGGIFKVKDKFFKENPTQKSLLNSSGLKKSDIEQKRQLISGLWFSQISIDKQIINKGVTAYPVQYATQVLPSDSNFRLDVLMHRFNDLARSQSSKEVLEGIQRNDKKLRDKFKKNGGKTTQ